MQNYKKLYTHLFNAMTDSINAINQQDFGTAKDIMVKAQQKVEELYLDMQEK